MIILKKTKDIQPEGDGFGSTLNERVLCLVKNKDGFKLRYYNPNSGKWLIDSNDEGGEPEGTYEYWAYLDHEKENIKAVKDAINELKSFVFDNDLIDGTGDSTEKEIIDLIMKIESNLGIENSFKINSDDYPDYNNNIAVG